MKSTYQVDPMGRIMIPAHIRKRLNIEPKSIVSIEIDGKSIVIRKAHETCVICGKPINNQNQSQRTAAGSAICTACAKMIGVRNGND